MRKIIVSTYVKSLFIFITLFVGAIIAFSILIAGVGNKNISGKNSINPFLPRFNAKTDDKNTTGPKISVFISKENNIKEMYLEEYVKGVVAAEMPASFEPEALQAQAVAARTYAAAHIKSFGGTPCDNANGADICDTVKAQVFMSKSERLETWPKDQGEDYWNKITAAVQKTVGQVLIYDNKLVLEPYYFAVSSGKTESAEEVFDSNEPYLKSVSSPGEENAPKFKSTEKVTYSDLAYKINSRYPKAGITAKGLKNQINILSRNEGGSVKEIKLGKITISGQEFRTMLGLNSANFTVSFNTNSVSVNCIGYGHGVGMSQWGANAMAKQGESYIGILKHYYQGIEIGKINNISP